MPTQKGSAGENDWTKVYGARCVRLIDSVNQWLNISRDSSAVVGQPPTLVWRGGGEVPNTPCVEAILVLLRGARGEHPTNILRVLPTLTWYWVALRVPSVLSVLCFFH